MTPFQRFLLSGIGALCVGLAVLGVFLPVLPTTPFLLLAAWCFSKSSDRMHRWLLSHRWLGPYITNYREGRGMSPRDKVVTLVTLWLSIGLAVGVFIPVWWVDLIVGSIATAVSFHILRIPSLRPERETRPEPAGWEGE